jgi:hypothetical protein
LQLRPHIADFGCRVWLGAVNDLPDLDPDKLGAANRTQAVAHAREPHLLR